MKRTLLAVVAAAALSGAAQARAEPFTIFVYETPADLALRTATDTAGRDYWAAWTAYSDVLKASLRGGAPLQPRAGGPVSSEPQLSGYFIIDAPDEKAAGALASQAPSVRRGGAAEARASFAAPNMAR